jgi:integrase
MSKGWKRRKAGRVVRRTLADGTVKEYRYAAYKKAETSLRPDSIELLIRAYQRSPHWDDLAPNTKSGYRTYLLPLEQAFGALPAKELTRGDIITVRDGISRTRGRGAATGFIRAVGSLFDWAVDSDQIDRSPVYKIKRLEGGHLQAWTVEQAEVALAGLPEHFRRAVVLGLYTGQRRGDLCKVKWSAYDGRRIQFIQEKRQGKVTVVLDVHPALKSELDEWKKAKTADTILTDAKGRPWVPNKLSVTLPLALRGLALPPGLNVHGMRKLFAAVIAERGGTTNQIAAGTGHQTLSMVQLYTRSASQRVLSAEAIALLPEFGRKSDVTIDDTTITTKPVKP